MWTPFVGETRTETSNHRDPFPVKECYRYTHVRVSARYPPSCATARCTAQHVATPTMSILNFVRKISRSEVKS